MRPLRRATRLFSFTPQQSATLQSGVLEPDVNPVIGGYRVGELLGQGPLGKVYRAEQAATGQKAVIRGFARPDDADPGEWEQAKNQFRSLLEAHQRIADLPDAPESIQKVIAFGEEGNIFWIATEYFEGTTLRAILNKEGVLPMTRIVEILAKVAEAVDWMGEQGLPHTDLTPHNIIVVDTAGQSGSPRIRVEVINFGLAHARSKFGSPYAAPEQMAGAAGNRRADVYSIGAMLHEMLTGIPLFSGSTPEEITQRVLYSPPRIVIQRPQSAYKIVTAMVARQPEWRYQNVTEAVQDLMNNREPQFAVPDASASATPPDSSIAPDPIPVYIPDAIITPPAPVSVSNPVAPSLDRPFSGEPRSVHKPEITLQNYRLSDQDLIILRWRQQQEEQQRALEREQQQERLRPWIQRGVVLAVLGMLAVWGLTWREGYRYATVQRVQGEVLLQEGNSRRPLRAGDRIRADHHPIIITGAGGSVALAMPDNRLFLPQNSALSLLRLDYRFGAIRNLELYSGSVVGMLEADRQIRRFDVRVGPTLTRVRGAYFFLSADRNSLYAGAKKGNLQVDHNGQKQNLSEGSAVMLTGDTAEAQTVALDTFAPLTAKSETVLKDVAPTAVPLIAAVEDKVVAPLVGLGDTLWKLPTKANDQRAIGLSMVGMQSICTLLMTADTGEGLPEQLTLNTLQELGMKDKDRKRILDLFEDKRLLSYRRLPNGGYEVYARSLDSDHTLMRGSNGQVEVLNNEEKSEGSDKSSD